MTTKRIMKEDIHDRVTTSVRKGHRALLRRIADELNTDVSKMFRSAAEDYIRAHRHMLSDALRKELDSTNGRLL
jgi:gamma-glutamyl phosphate reductase